MTSLFVVSETDWAIHFEDFVSDAQAERKLPPKPGKGVAALKGFAFGFPSAIFLQDPTYQATYWCEEGGSCGIRWTNLRVS